VISYVYVRLRWSVVCMCAWGDQSCVCVLEVISHVCLGTVVVPSLMFVQATVVVPSLVFVPGTVVVPMTHHLKHTYTWLITSSTHTHDCSPQAHIHMTDHLKYTYTWLITSSTHTHDWSLSWLDTATYIKSGSRVKLVLCVQSWNWH
jgi:hypothetical protein